MHLLYQLKDLQDRLHNLRVEVTEISSTLGTTKPADTTETLKPLPSTGALPQCTETIANLREMIGEVQYHLTNIKEGLGLDTAEPTPEPGYVIKSSRLL